MNFQCSVVARSKHKPCNVCIMITFSLIFNKYAFIPLRDISISNIKLDELSKRKIHLTMKSILNSVACFEIPIVCTNQDNIIIFFNFQRKILFSNQYTLHSQHLLTRCTIQRGMKTQEIIMHFIA